MNGITLLKEDHRRIKRLFKQYEQAGPKAYRTRERLVREMTRELSVHAQIEETVFYPQVRTRIATTEDDVLESLEEHHIVKWTLDELEKLPPSHERYDAKVTVLMENVRHHMAEEEKDLFPKVQRALSRRELDDLGEEMESVSHIAPVRPHPRAPDEPPGNIIAAAAAAPMDVVVEGAKAATAKVLRRRR